MIQLRERFQNTRKGWQEFKADAARILPYFRPYQWYWVALLAVANLYTLLGLVDPLIMKFVIDKAILQKNLYLLNLSMVAFIVISLVSIVLGYYSSVLYERVSQNLLFDIRTDMFNHLSRMDILYFEEQETGDLLSRINTDIRSLESFLSLVYDDLIINVVKVLIIFAILAVLSWEFAAVTAIVVPILAVLQKHYGRIMRERYRHIREASASLLSFFQERLSSMRLIKTFEKEDQERDLQREKGKRIVDLNVKYVSTRQVAEALTGLLTFSIMLFVLWYGGYKVATDALSIGSLIAIYTYTARVFGPVRTLTDLNISLQTTIASARRVFEVLDAEPLVQEDPDAEPLPPVDGDIDIENVSFAYDGNQVFDDLSLHIDAGETVGLVGPSGAGKTTIARLIFRFFDPESGVVSIDGHDVRDVTIDSLREQIGVVEQDLLFFHASIRENIAYAKPDATEEEILDAAERAGVDEFVKRLPDGYDTSMGERGAQLSRGERQRIALARVFLKDPPIVIIDEATSSLDPESEKHVQESLHELSKEKTMIIIAHRLSTMQFVDRLLVLDNGEILEEGTFEELKGNRGRFWEMYRDRIDD